MALTLANLETRLKFICQDSNASSTAQTNRYNALADADVELSAIRGFWRVKSFAYTSSSSPAMTAGSATLAASTGSLTDFESPFRLYYRENGQVRDVAFVSDSEWLDRSDTTQSDYPSFARLTQSGSTKTIQLDRLLSSTFVSSIATLTLEYWISITRLASSSDESILPDTLRHHIVPLAGLFYARAQGDAVLAKELEGDAERAREAVLRFDIQRLSRPRQIRPQAAYAPSDSGDTSTDYNH